MSWVRPDGNDPTQICAESSGTDDVGTCAETFRPRSEQKRQRHPRTEQSGTAAAANWASTRYMAGAGDLDGGRIGIRGERERSAAP